MSENKDFVASGLSLAPNDKAHVSTLLRQVEEAIGQLQSGQGEPWLTTLRDAAEQREDLSAASRACYCLAIYYGALLAGGNRTIADYDRALYYAQTLKDCGPESQGLHHAVCGVLLLYQMHPTINTNDWNARDGLVPATDHLHAAIRAEEPIGAEFVVENCDKLNLLCHDRYGDICSATENWGLIYAAYRLLARDPNRTPMQREENAAKATATLQEVRDLLKDLFSRKSPNHVRRSTKDYPNQLRIAQESQPTPEDEAIIRQFTSGSFNRELLLLKVYRKTILVSLLSIFFVFFFHFHVAAIIAAAIAVFVVYWGDRYS